MSKILTNYEKLYVENEKEGSRIISLTSSLPITLNLTNYSQNLKGNVKVVISGNNTTTPSVKIEFSDLYKYGETYSASLIAWNGQDGITIPIIINNSDTLIYTNIPNNVINDISSGAYIKYTSIPEVRSMKILYPSITKDYSDKLDVGNGYSSAWLTEMDLKYADYIQASNTLSKLSIKVGAGTSINYGDYVLERITISPIIVSYKGGDVIIKFKSNVSGKPVTDIDDFELKHEGLTHKSWDESYGVVTWKLSIGENTDDEEISYNVSVKARNYKSELDWVVKQNSASYVFERITETPINIGSKAQIIEIQFYSKWGDDPFDLFSMTTGEASYVGMDSLGGGKFRVRLQVSENVTAIDKQYKIVYTQYRSGLTLSWTINQSCKANDYVFERVTENPITIDYTSQNIYIKFKSLYLNEPFEDFTFSTSLKYIGVEYKEHGVYMMTLEVDENSGTGNIIRELTIKQGTSNRELTWVISQEFNTGDAPQGGNTFVFVGSQCRVTGGYATPILSKFPSGTATAQATTLTATIQKFEYNGNDMTSSVKQGYDFDEIKHVSETWIPYSTWRNKYFFDFGAGDFKEANINFRLWDTSNAGGLFEYSVALYLVPLFNTSGVTNMRNMFHYCISLTSVPLFDTSKVTNMEGMFDSCRSISYIPHFNTSKVTNMGNMFVGCKALKEVPLFATGNVSDMHGMFDGCRSLKEVPLFDTSNVTDMSGMFMDCSSLISIPLFDTSSVTSMASMFGRNWDDGDFGIDYYGCRSLKEVPLFDTSKVTNMRGMFDGCRSLKEVPLFDTGKVTNMKDTFAGCTSLATIPQLNTSLVTNMEGMFAGCTSLTSVPDLSASRVGYYYDALFSTFYGCSNLTYLGGFKYLKWSLSLSDSPLLTYDSLMNVINNLSSDVIGYGTTLELNRESLKKLSDEDIMIAMNKGWNITSV